MWGPAAVRTLSTGSKQEQNIDLLPPAQSLPGTESTTGWLHLKCCLHVVCLRNVYLQDGSSENSAIGRKSYAVMFTKYEEHITEE